MKPFDVVVVGVGGMGSAACWHLARRGQRVLGLERFDVPHAMGSSHGITRIIRLPYYEDPAYVPLLRRAYALWRELGETTGRTVLVTHGSIDAGPEDGPLFGGALASARLHGLPHEVLTGGEVNARFPAYRLPAEQRAVIQPEGGRPGSAPSSPTCAPRRRPGPRYARGSRWRAGTRGRAARASSFGRTRGATRRAGRCSPPVLGWRRSPRPCRPRRAGTAGPGVAAAAAAAAVRDGHRGERMPAEAMRREVDAEDERLLRVFAERYFPEGAGATMALRACMFTNTPDEHFILDRHPDFPQVVLASPCSGHGYKFCSVVGEILADLASGDGATEHDIGFLRLGRLQAGG